MSSSDPGEILRNVFGYPAFREGQQAVIEAVLTGRDVLAVMPTGSGKSLCFQIPALALGGLAIVVSPLIALMRDQIEALRLAGVAAEMINSSQSRDGNVAAWRRAAAGDCRLLYMAPERLMDERMLRALQRLPLSLIAIDEAHCISQWGPSFRPEYEQLGALKDWFPNVPLAALTATADEITRQDIAARLLRGDALVEVTGFDRPNIGLSVEVKRDWKRQLAGFLADRRGESGIVYCLSRRKTEAVAADLAAAGFEALAYHAGMGKADRERHQTRFIAEDGIVMVATIAFGMGIDKPDVRFVCHTDLPASIEAYYQEFGRAGRDGAPAEARLLYGLDDIRMRRMFIENEESSAENKRLAHRRLDALIGYCEAPRCRRQVLLRYFGAPGEACGNCDGCLDPVALTDGTEEARNALLAVITTGQLYGVAHIGDVLRGQETEKAIKAGHERLPVFGTGAAMSQREWRSILRQLVAAGYLSVDIAGFGGLKMTAAGRGFLDDGDQRFDYRPDSAGGKTTARRAAKADAEPLNDDDEALFQRLRQLRRNLAKARGVRPYLIFSDRSLADMARRRPGDRAAFAEIHGVGEAKLRDLAKPFLEAIADVAAGGA